MYKKISGKAMRKASIITILLFIFSIFSGFIGINEKEDKSINMDELSEGLRYDPHDPEITGHTSFKIDPPNSGTYTKESLQITISVSKDNTLNWQSNIPIYCVYVKGGNETGDEGKAFGYVYKYNGVLAGNGLHAIMKNGQYQGISHVTFYYKEQQPPPVTGTINVEKKLVDANGNIINGDETEFSIKIKDSNELEKGNEKIKAGETKSFNELPLGSYTISEENIPEGYELVNNVEELKAEITAENREARVVITNRKKPIIPPPLKGTINVEKKLVDEKGNIINGDETEFSIKIKDSNELEKGNEKIKAGETKNFSELPLGSYTISEENIPEGYELVNNVEELKAEITAENREARVVITNRKKPIIPPPLKGTINVEKKLVDANGNIINGDGTEFNIKIKDSNRLEKGNEKIKAGETKSFSELPLGSYTISEENIPEGYELVNNVEELKAEITAENREAKVVITNRKKPIIPPPLKGTINVEKKLVDEKGNIINGDETEFSIKIKDSNRLEKGNEKIKAGETKSFSELPLGSYTISEENIPEGYELVNNVEELKAEITAENREARVVITNRKKPIIPPPLKGTINVEKKLVDANGNIINGDVTEFSIKVAGNDKIYEDKIKAGGAKGFKDISLGSYIISEENIPRGYELVNIDKSEVNLTNENKEVKVIITNKKKPSNPPSDGGGGPSISYGSIGDYIWLDENEDGKQDANEKGIPNVKVILTKPDGTKVQTSTDSSGKYKFSNLLSGKYTVTIDDTTLPKELKATYELDGILDYAVVVELKSGEVREDVDFGYTRIKTDNIDDKVPEEDKDKPEDKGKVEDDKKPIDQKPVDNKPNNNKIPQTGTENFNILLLGALTSIVSGVYIILSKKKDHMA